MGQGFDDFYLIQIRHAFIHLLPISVLHPAGMFQISAVLLLNVFVAQHFKIIGDENGP